MKTLIKTWHDLEKAARWDIDFHLPAERILQFDPSILKRVDEVADIASGKRDPGSLPDDTFQYIDIAAAMYPQASSRTHKMSKALRHRLERERSFAHLM